jgi:hypothetical protein
MMSFLSTLSDIYGNVAGPSAVIMALIMYSKWAREVWAKRALLSFFVCAVLAALLVADILAHHPSWIEPELTTVVNHKFSNEVVVLDGHDYEHCTFENVTFEYDGGAFKMVNNTGSGILIKTKNRDVERGMAFLGKMGLSRVPLIDSETGKTIEPGVTWGTIAPRT